ncbi:hypothetical protein PV08_03334 [Exophiala spinifera]|uniref:Uncharacterized protein n=1 Tax=Exophiala spinifera TaxID=91928 RepID=A0A0D2C687_9EURO|nr:uncharacterized protein PV08_03334 [Exophiala spinifera]KIW19044.1 hypothetical protein PV08_03334 [Exophiala spinifera]
MTTIPSVAFHDMDAPHLDDQMDVASSPFRQVDDIDIDLDSVRDPSVIGSVNDDMVDDDRVQLDNHDTGFVQTQAEVAVADDDMIDETNPEDLDFNMDGDAGDIPVDEDEDILYEEEEVDTSIQPEGDVARTNIEAVAEVDLVDFETDAASQPQPFHETEETFLPVEDEQSLPEDTLIHSEENVQEDSELILEQVGQDVSGEKDHTLPQEQTAGDYQTQAKSSVEHLPNESADGRDQSDTAPHTVDGSDSVPQEYEAVEAATNDHPPPHPVTLNYMDEEMSLFPPMMEDASAVYFLQDSTLAFEPLDKLLAACREILTGTLEHHDELVLDIGSLGLHICEDSKYASQLSLSQILDTYLLLCHNDGTQEIPPLYCYLSSRVSLASQYAYLLSSATEGKGFSEVAAEYVDTPEPEEAQDGSAIEHSPEHLEQPATIAEQYPNNVEGSVIGNTEREDAIPDDDDTGKSPAFEEGSEPVADTDANPDDAEADLAHPTESEDVTTTQEPAGANEAPEVDAPVAVGEMSQEAHDGPSGEILHDEGGHELEDSHRPESHEDETNSSHTLEAYPPEADEDQVSGEEVDVENLFAESYEHIDLEHDQPAPQDEEGVESFGDEELFTKESEADLLENDLATTAAEPAQPAAINPEGREELPNGHDAVPASNFPGLNGGGISAESSLQPPQNTSPPVTPSKNMHAKRKADDDDELDLLDFDTPEPKRRRPS